MPSATEIRYLISMTSIQPHTTLYDIKERQKYDRRNADVSKKKVFSEEILYSDARTVVPTTLDMTEPCILKANFFFRYFEPTVFKNRDFGP